MLNVMSSHGMRRRPFGRQDDFPCEGDFLPLALPLRSPHGRPRKDVVFRGAAGCLCRAMAWFKRNSPDRGSAFGLRPHHQADFS